MIGKETESRIYYHTRAVEKSNFMRSCLLFAIAAMLALLLGVMSAIKDTLVVIAQEQITDNNSKNKEKTQIPLL